MVGLSGQALIIHLFGVVATKVENVLPPSFETATELSRAPSAVTLRDERMTSPLGENATWSWQHGQAVLRKSNRSGNTGFHVAPSDTYQTKDGWIIIHVIGNPMFNRWAKLVGRDDLVDDPRCADDISRANNHQLITEAMND